MSDQFYALSIVLGTFIVVGGPLLLLAYLDESGLGRVILDWRKSKKRQALENVLGISRESFRDLANVTYNFQNQRILKLEETLEKLTAKKSKK